MRVNRLGCALPTHFVVVVQHGGLLTVQSVTPSTSSPFPKTMFLAYSSVRSTEFWEKGGSCLLLETVGQSSSQFAPPSR